MIPGLAQRRRLGKLPGIISAALHRSKDGTCVINYAQWKTTENWESLFRIGSESWFREMGKYAKPDAHLYEVCYLLDKTDNERVRRAVERHSTPGALRCAKDWEAKSREQRRPNCYR